MIESHLTGFATKRRESLQGVDQELYPEAKVEELIHAQGPRPSLRETLLDPTCLALVEVKKASPTMGTMSEEPGVDLCRRYVEGGAKALSVLVDQVNFKGHPKDLEACVQAFPHLPFLFKDFVSTPYQVRLAKAIGASSVLLMTQLLEKEELEDLFELCRTLDLEPFVETHDREELEWTLELSPPIVGINARDFKTPGLPIDLSTAPRILADLEKPWPEQVALVAQSGVEAENQWEELRRACPAGLPHVLQIGSMLTKSGALPPWLSSP